MGFADFDIGTLLHLGVAAVTIFGWLSIERLVRQQSSAPTERAVVQAAEEWLADLPGSRQKLTAAVKAYQEHQKQWGRHAR